MMRTVFLLAACALAGCSRNWDAVLRDGSIDSIANTESSTDAAVIDAPVAPCNAMEMADPTAIYVSPGALSGDGSAMAPFGTIAAAVSLAAARNVSIVYLNEGEYIEQVTVPYTPAGVVLTGGFRRSGANWRRNCDADQRSGTLITPGSAVGITFRDARARSGLANLTVATKPSGAMSGATPAETLIGVLVVGDSSVVALRNVAVIAGAGGSAEQPVAPAAAGNIACNGRMGCSTSAPPPGGTGADGADASRQGTFDPTGFTPADGAQGTPGQPGANGLIGGPGAPPVQQCHYCGSNMCNLGDGSPAPSGTCGCGGLAGGGGSAGRGGGASVALLVSGNATVIDAQHCLLRAQSGGSGAAGTAGGAPGGGTMGAPGATVDCFGGCDTSNPSACYGTNNMRMAGGAMGGPGSAGGMGGHGGAGAGGPSYGVVTLGTANATVDGTNLVMNGPGGVGDPNGDAAPRFHAP